MKRILPPSFYNPLSLVGMVIVATNFALIVFITLMIMLTDHSGPYADIVIYFLLPLVASGGIVLMVVGAVLERRRKRAGLPERRLPVVDFNDARQRTTVLTLVATFVVLTLAYAFAGYKTYEFSESTQFCGTTCHGIMKPEFTAHRVSQHAEVDCVECHVGSGAKYFVEAKLGGTRMLMGTLTGRYSRPIPVPVHNLRPSPETCETCHGPRIQATQRLESHTVYRTDSANTPWTVDLILRMGQVEGVTDPPARMHWHSSTTRQIQYATSDGKRVDIPWLQVERLDGTVRTYRRTDSTATAEELAALPRRTMDCVDCHNRAGHYIRPPAQAVNEAMSLALIDPALPDLKRVAVEALDADYATRDAAHADIRNRIETLYRDDHPTVATAMKPQIDRAIVELQNIYDRNYDPFMKTNWKSYPDNAGHMYSQGCFRCHDGKHVADDGHVLSNDCTLCHTLVKHDVADNGRSAVLTLMDYPHPEDVGDAYKEALCSDCHGAN